MKIRDVKIRDVRKEKDEVVIEGTRKGRQRRPGGVADAEPLRNLTEMTLMTRMTRTTPLAEEEMASMTKMAAVMVMASATKNTIMEDDNAGTAVVTGAM
jgi:spore coat protein CotH